LVGGSVVIDGSFSTASEREAARVLARRRGIPFTAVWCAAADDVVAARLRRHVEDRHEVSDGREELLGGHRAQYQLPVGETDVIRVDTGDGALRDVNAMLAVVAAHTASKEGT
jgi:predicted kinase